MRRSVPRRNIRRSAAISILPASLRPRIASLVRGTRGLILAAGQARRAARSGRPVIMLCPGDNGSGTASDLRARALAPHLFALGWAPVVMPPDCSLWQRRRIIRLAKPRLLFLHQTRHPLNDPALYPGLPSILDVDDADILDPRHHERIERIATASAAVVAGGRYLRDRFATLAPRTAVLWTGTYMLDAPGSISNAARAPIITWAHSEPLSYMPEFEFIRDVLLSLADRQPFSFALFGVRDDQREAAAAFLAPLAERGIEIVLHGPMPLDAFVRSLGTAAIGLHPVAPGHAFSLGKSFGKLLAYMAADLAVVTTDAVDHPLFFRDGVNGRLLPHDVAVWTEACAALLADPAGRQEIIDAARGDFRRRLTTRRFAELLDARLRTWFAID